jgi:predicted metalloendopeptidase
MRRASAGALLVSVLATLDPGVRPQDDLFASVNAEWLRTTDIPPDRVSYGTFGEISDRTETDLRVIVEDVIAGRARAAGATRQQIAALYESATGEAQIEVRGATPLADELARIDAIRSPASLAGETGRLSSLGTGGPFDGGPVADPQHPGQTIVRVLPGGTLLPDLRYYSDAAKPFVEARLAYEGYLQQIFTLTRRDAPRDAAREVVALETELAKAQWGTGVPEEAPGRFTLRELAGTMPGWDWQAWARPQGLDRVPALVLERPAFFKDFAALVPAVPLRVWHNWLVARYVTAAAPFLSAPFDRARYDFFGATLTGQVAPRPRWKRGVDMVSSYLGDAIGRVYVERHLPDATRTRARRLLDTILETSRASVRGSALSSGAKRDALAQLTTMTAGLGAPTAWHDYGGLVLRPGDLFGNWLRALAFESADRERAAAGTLPRSWARPPQTVNAYYEPATNEIAIPAALLQPPIFDPDAEDATNYGALGALAGHEIAHALGAGENAADAVGLAVALRAYHAALHGAAAPVIDGLTGDQRFFLSWARVWRAKERPEYTRSLAESAYRAPRDRANSAASSVDGFYDAFGVRAGDGMYRSPDRRLRIW